MCGIAGFCNFRYNFLANREKNTGILMRMREAIAHRGNDQTGEYLCEKVGLSHTRLSIRDLSKGIQPMIRYKNNSEYVIVYNGEIYNTEELTRELKNKGFIFETTCDTEVILNAYIEYGADCAKHLNGIFAFAIWDSYKAQLLLIRDRVGVKPLFYTVCDGELIFGSEIKSLFAHPNVKPCVNMNSFREIFGIGPARTPSCGVFENIHELCAGCYTVFNNNGISINKYWNITSQIHTDDYATTVSNVSYLVRDAIARQMISDVPVCSFLSGGLDSSIVTVIAADVMKREGAKLNTYSFDFSGNDKYFSSNSFQPERDRPYVDMMLSHTDTNHTYLECDETQLADLLRDSMLSKDLPGMADIDASLMYFCALVKQKNKVALTGECADEIFGGYPWFYRQELLQGDGFPWSRQLSVRECLLQDDFIRKLDLHSYVKERYAESVREVPTLDGESLTEANRRKNAYLNIKWFMQTLLDRMDRASMHSGLEARVPFADHRIIEYVFNVPWEMKYRNNIEKSLLRDAFSDILPHELLYRKKSPYPKTYNPSYERLLKEKLSSILANSNSPLHMFIDKRKVQNFFDSPTEYGKPWFGQLMAAPQLIAYFVQINDWLEEYKPQINL